MRKDEVKALLEHAEKDLNKIETKYNDALRSKDISNELKIDIKNFLENLRSVLDYMANDIYECKIHPHRTTSGQPDIKNVYFPYGKTLGDFNSGIGRGLPELGDIDNDLYLLVESIQPHITNDSWLYDFCDITNQKKHDSLTPQERIENNTTSLGGNIRIGAGARVVMHNCLVNGIPVSSNDVNNEPLENFDSRLNVQRTTWISFNFSDTNIAVLPFLKKIHSNINSFSDKIYLHLSK